MILNIDVFFVTNANMCWEIAAQFLKSVNYRLILKARFNVSHGGNLYPQQKAPQGSRQPQVLQRQLWPGFGRKV
jgi:hypothetical protein